MRARLLLNPSSGRRRGERHRDRLRSLARAADVEFEESANAADLVERARRAREEGLERLLVGGGDGTLHWAAQGLVGGETALAPVPLGTGNDLARELGLPLDPEAAFTAALEGERDRIDVGTLDGRCFFVVAGVGFDAATAEYARSRVRRLRGPAVYAWATLATLVRYRTPRIELESPAGTFRGEVFFVAFANTSHYGGGMRIAPDADPHDGLLDVLIVRRVSKLRLLAVFPRVYRGSHLGHPAIELLRVSSARLRTDSPQPINADGEGIGETAASALQIGLRLRDLAVVRGEHKH